MSDGIEDGGPAYPLFADGTHARDLNSIANEGMSLRDWFAGQALAGDWAAQAECGFYVQNQNLDERAKLYYKTADAMLKARKGGG